MTITIEEADSLVVDNQGWAISIARSVARAWNLDFQNDGLDGAALEALLFCSRRYDPSRGVPFRGYSRRRIHEASTEAARRSKGWQQRSSPDTTEARNLSAELIEIFPELRSGELPSDGGDSSDVRGMIRGLVMSASILACQHDESSSSAEDMLDLKRLVGLISGLEPVHQTILWKMYWDGASMREIAQDWSMDELNVIREHFVLLAFLQKSLSLGKNRLTPPPVRPGLKDINAQLRRSGEAGPFLRVMRGEMPRMTRSARSKVPSERPIPEDTCKEGESS